MTPPTAEQVICLRIHPVLWRSSPWDEERAGSVGATGSVLPVRPEDLRGQLSGDPSTVQAQIVQQLDAMLQESKESEVLLLDEAVVAVLVPFQPVTAGAALSILVGGALGLLDKASRTRAGLPGRLSDARCVVYQALRTIGQDGRTLLIDLQPGLAGLLTQLCPAGSVCIDEALRPHSVHQLRTVPIDIPFHPTWHGLHRVEEVLEAAVPLPTSKLAQLAAAVHRLLIHRILQTYEGLAQQAGGLVVSLAFGDDTEIPPVMEALISEVQARNLTLSWACNPTHCRWNVLSPIVRWCLNLLGVEPGEAAAVTRTRIRVMARRVLLLEGYRDETLQGEVVELVGLLEALLLGRSWHDREDGSLTWLEPAAVRERLFFGLLRFIRGLSQQHPLLLVLENPELTDSLTLEFLRFLTVALATRGRVMVVIATTSLWRSRNPEWGEGSGCHQWWTVERGQVTALQDALFSLMGNKTEQDDVIELLEATQGRLVLGAATAMVWREAMAERSRDKRRAARLWAGVQEVLRLFSRPDGSEAPRRRRDTSSSWRRKDMSAETSQAVRAEMLRLHEDSSRTVEDDSLVVEADEEEAPEQIRSDEQVLLEESVADVPIPTDTVALKHAEQWRKGLRRLLMLQVGLLKSSGQRVLLFLNALGPVLSVKLTERAWSLMREPADVLNDGLVQLRSVGLLIFRNIPGGQDSLVQLLTPPWLETILPGASPTLLMHFHRALARALEAGAEGGWERIGYASLAMEFRQGQEMDKALRYFLLAGRRAEGVLSLQEAEYLLGQALELVGRAGLVAGSKEWGALALAHARSLLSLERWGEAREGFEQARKLAELRQDTAQVVSALLGLCEVHRLRQERGPAAQIAELVLNREWDRVFGVEGPDERSSVDVLLRDAHSLMVLEQWGSASAALDLAERCAEGKPARLAGIMEARAVWHSLQGELPQAVAALNRSLALLSTR